MKTYEEFTFDQKYRGITFKEYYDELPFDLKDNLRYDINHRSIISLEGIEDLTNLAYLDCGFNRLTSLKGLENLSNLHYLNCCSNGITSLKPIENLTNLTFLSIIFNELTSLKEVKNLTKLEDFYVWGNPKLTWIDYIDKQGNTWYVKLPKSIKRFRTERIGNVQGFENIDEYWEWFDKNQPVSVSRKFNF